MNTYGSTESGTTGKHDHEQAGDREGRRRTIHRFTVSRCATTLDPLEVVADATRQAQAEQVVGMLKSRDGMYDRDALDYYYENDRCSGEAYVDLIVWGADRLHVHTAALTLHGRYEGHPEPQDILEEVEVSA